MRFSAAAVALAALAPLPAFALAAPTPGSKDSRVRVLTYDPMQVYDLELTGLSPVQIILDPDEHPALISGPMVQVVGGEAANKGEQAAPAPTDWMARPSGNVLMLAPIHSMPPTIMLLHTKKDDGTERDYQFELHTRDGTLIGAADAGAYMSVRFLYAKAALPPAPDQVVARAEAAHARQIAAETRAVNQELDVAANTGPRNKDYWMHGNGCATLAPLYAYDDGSTTTMSFAPNATLPAFSEARKGQPEAVLNINPAQTSGGPLVRLPGVYDEVRLRAGMLVCALTPHAPGGVADPIGREPGDGSGTVSPFIQRELRAAH